MYIELENEHFLSTWKLEFMLHYQLTQAMILCLKE